MIYGKKTTAKGSAHTNLHLKCIIMKNKDVNSNIPLKEFVEKLSKLPLQFQMIIILITNNHFNKL